MWRLVPVGILFIASFGCKQEQHMPDDTLMAEVYDHQLYLSRAKNYRPDAESPDDSLSQLRNYVEMWVREALLLHEAEKYVPEDIDIRALVEDYRASLIISNYEKSIVESSLDTVITDEDGGISINPATGANSSDSAMKMPTSSCWKTVHGTGPTSSQPLYRPVLCRRTICAKTAR